MSGLLEPQYRRDYMLGGNATVTLVSKRTGDRYTYRINKSKDEPGRSPVFFVSVLTGPDNTSDFDFLGTIFPQNGKFKVSPKSRIAPTAPSAEAFKWTWANLDSDKVEVWHEGACSRCGRPLTDPESIRRGIGPTCAEHML